ncbi:NAD(P)H-quinone oxidoreductase subunit 3 [Poriferisphaera corsica]|uniref:NADH-quinone oxidoreductase subunit n=1 Tax=Poriferisphaera corsica TaxID=2528020 RepID=A0A517YRE2_9BACT|nr:NADH-quinone oxidoreductase subunit A [Poriferisphaera corsica]QDU32792.1 NAD(P)H-quinone oxidoreductase subunit 3 [Poriferisphaera corsica]
MATILGMSTLLAVEEFNHYAAIGLLVLIGLGFGLGNVVITHLLGPSRKGKVKGSVYESGVNPLAETRRRFNVRFYVVAMTFLLFDVEIVFLYPWAVDFLSLGGDASDANNLPTLFLGRMLFFVLTTIVAYAYAFRKGVFRYD